MGLVHKSESCVECRPCAGTPNRLSRALLDYRDGKVQIDRFVALGLGWAFVSYACRVFFSVSDMDVLMRWWWCGGVGEQGKEG